MECLRSGGWLNDEVINFWMYLYQERELVAMPGEPATMSIYASCLSSIASSAYDSRGCR
jgi:hypothetical protein